MAYSNDKECEAAGLDPIKVERIAARFERVMKDCRAMGMFVFGGSGHGTLRFHGDHPLILGSIGMGFDGGCGACREDEEGLLRGE